MRHRLVTALCGLGVVCLLALVMLVCSDRSESKSLTCSDLLDMPLEALMEVRIVSRSNDHPSGQTLSTYPPLRLNAPRNDQIQVLTVCDTFSV
jgi:hypothetical protein